MKITLGKATYRGYQGHENLFLTSLRPRGTSAPEGVLAVITDGVGGMASEREAAHFALQRVIRDLAKLTRGESVAKTLARALDSANDVVCTVAQAHVDEGVVGVSLVTALVFGKTLYWRAVGDCRLYCLRNGELIQLTRDHTVARHLRLKVLKGELSLADVERNPDRDALTSYLGMDPLPEVDANIKPFTLSGGDRLLLCSNGVHSVLSEERMAATLVFDAQTAAQELVTLAGSRSGNELDAIHAAVICLPASEWREGASDYPSPGPGGPGARIAQRKSRLANYLPRPAVVSGISRTGLVVAGLVITAIASVAISLFLLLKDPGGQEAEREEQPSAMNLPQIEHPPAQPPLAIPVSKPRLQYRDLEPRRP